MPIRDLLACAPGCGGSCAGASSRRKAPADAGAAPIASGRPGASGSPGPTVAKWPTTYAAPSQRRGTGRPGCGATDEADRGSRDQRVVRLQLTAPAASAWTPSPRPISRARAARTHASERVARFHAHQPLHGIERGLDRTVFRRRDSYSPVLATSEAVEESWPRGRVPGVGQDRRQFLGHDLPELDAPLVERVDAPDGPSTKHGVLVERDELPQTTCELRGENGGAGAVAGMTCGARGLGVPSARSPLPSCRRRAPCLRQAVRIRRSAGPRVVGGLGEAMKSAGSASSLVDQL